MSKTTSESNKYHIQIGQAQGPVIGDDAHVEQHFHAATPPPPASRGELLTAIHQASAELRAYPSDIAGIHIERTEVAEIVEWALKADPKERLGMLQDQPGGGKTVVMRDVLECLEAANVPVLAIKADTLSGIKTRDDLADRLGLPALVEECAHHLVTEGPFVVVLDQLDALSLALSRDQATLDVMLSTLARLRELDGMRIVASCRTFDLNNDPRLSTIKVDRKFQLHPLDKAQVNRVLQAIGIDSARLLPAHRALLTVPLHLKVHAQVVAGDAPKYAPESFRTLQELYEALWQKRIEAVPPDTPPPPERIAAIYRLVEAMQNSRQVTVPVAVLDELAEAANYLERVGFVRREGSNWLFFHQTLFDYCYARRFVAQGGSLSQEILSGPQGLFERSQMVQVLAYLRGADEAAYRRELTALLFADNLRVHLRLLLIGWFGSPPDPTADELRIARQLMSDADDRTRFLQAASGNEGWFDLLNDDVVPSWLRTDDERLIGVVINYLGTLIQRRTDAVLARLRPYLSKSEFWDSGIAFCLSRLGDWQSEEALDMLYDLLRRGRTAGWEDHCLQQLAHSNPAAGCQALRAYLDRRLDDLLTQEKAESQIAGTDPHAVSETGPPDHFAWNRQLLGEYAIDEVMKQAVQVCPEKVIEHLLPWFVRTVEAVTAPREENDYYSSDSLFAWGWYGDYISEGPVFALRIVEALRHLAQRQPADFRAIAAELAAIESLAVQRVLAQAYLSAPGTYTNDIFKYLTTDSRRLNIGERLESPHYDSCRLYSAAFRHVDGERRAVLEQLILDLQPAWEQRSLRHRGLTQLRFLKSVPPDLLSETARSRLQELERKFPGFELHPPEGVRGGAVGPPIEPASQEKMSDDDWLGAMRKYDDSGYAPPDFLKGGVYELSLSFAEQVKADPERFYRLAQRFDETISLYYVKAAISGLAESNAPAEWVFDLVRHFAPRIEGQFRRSVCWALEKRAEAGVPDDLLDLMADWALHDPDPTEELWCVPAGSGEPYHGGDPHHHGINTNRGAAIQAVCHCALARTPPQVERAFQLLEQTADDPSTAVRTCVIQILGPFLKKDDRRTLAVFERTLDGHPRLLQTPLVHRFLSWTYYHHFARIRPFIEDLLIDADDATRQAGASLACLAAFRHPEANELAEQAVHGNIAMRRGAARIYARNLEHPDLEATCQERLLQLMQDPDEQVRTHVGWCFEHLRPEHLDRLQPFIERFLASPALMNGAEHLVKYLAPLAADAPDLALTATEYVLDSMGSEVVDIRTSAALVERDLVVLLLTVYNHSDDPDTEVHAMDLFESLLLLGSRSAFQALSDWDGQGYPILAVPRHVPKLSRVEQETILIEESIEALRRRLRRVEREAQPTEWAQVITDLATVYRERIRGDRAENIEQAIAYYHKALEVLTPEKSPVDWAMTQVNLAMAYRERIRGDRAENIEQAIAYYHQALKVLTREERPVDWATTQVNLATAYRERIRGDRAENIEQAITYYHQALEVLTREERLVDWATTQVNLATAYRERIRGDRAENIEQAIACYHQALEVYTQEAAPVDWAMIQNNLATAYRERIRGDRAENIEQAIAYYHQALEVLTREERPVDWATTQVNLAMAYRERIRGDQAENIERAIEHYTQALVVYTREAFPAGWAMAQNNLANAYSERIRGKRAENIEQAITYYRAALEVYTRQAFPAEWAMTQNNLAHAYSERIWGERAENIERAIAHYSQALEMYTRQAFPAEWAMTRNNLATAYLDRVRGERTENLKQALFHLQQALEVYSREAFPDQSSAVVRRLEATQRELVLVEFFALWNTSQVEDIDRRVRQFCDLFSKLAALPLRNYHALPDDEAYLGIFDLSEVFQDLPLSFAEKFPVLFLVADRLNDHHLERMRQILNDHLGPSSRRAILIPFCNDQAFLDAKNLVGGPMKRVHAYNIICLSRSDLEQIIPSENPCNELRRTILLQADLTSIPLYNTSGPTADNMFFGRERELQEICDHAVSVNYALIGGRRIGKTSILKRLERVRLPAADFRAFYHDCSFTPTQVDLVQAMAADKTWFPEPPASLPASFAGIIQALPDDRPLVILLDEADKLIAPDRAAGYLFFNTLRALANSDRCRFVLSGERTLRAELTDPNSPLYNFANEMLIGRLDFRAVEELVTRPMKQLEIELTDETEMVQRIWGFTSGHPSVVQRLCQRLIVRLNQRGGHCLTLDDVEAVVVDPDFLRKDFLNIYWERATALECLCSLVMAADDSVRTLTAVHETLCRHDIRTTLNEVDDALERLVDLRNILQRTAEGYEFAVAAFPQVIAKTARLEDLIALNRETYQRHDDAEPRSKRGVS